MKKIILLIIAAAILVIGFILLRPVFVDDVVEESLPENFFVSVEEEVTEESIPEKEEQADLEELDIQVESAPVSSGPTVVAQGMFVDADAVHKGSGRASIISNGESNLLRFEDFEVTNGPDLFVVLAENEQPADHNEFGEYLELGRLKGNIGNQNYMIPDDIDVSKYGSVVVYCKAFSVVFSTASLQ